MYLSYEEYLNYGGTLDRVTFNNYVFEAEAIINYYTFNRLMNDKTVSQSVKQLTYVLINIAQKKASALALGMSNSTESNTGVYITRQSNDDVDTTYNSMSAANLFNLCKSEANQAIRRYLNNITNEAGHKVTYRGLYPGE